MSDHLSAFIDHMTAQGYGPARPAEINQADDEWHYYTLSGDKPNVKKGSYRLRTDGNGFAVGNFGSQREGVFHTYTSKAPKHYDADQIKAHRDKIAREKVESEARQRAEYDAVAAQAKLHWDMMGIAPPDQSYLARKDIQAHGTRVDKDGNLVVPIYIKNALRNYQTIYDDGGKYPLKGGEIRGGYFPLANKDDDKSRLVVCEGFATAASIRQATKLPVIVAFNKGNLEPVAKFIKEKYPDAQIIIAADNDQWSWEGRAKAKHCPADVVTDDIAGDDIRWKNWRKMGYLLNGGIEWAQKAAASIGGAHVIWPEFSEDDPARRTDYNDLHVTEGLQAVHDRILQIPKVVEPETTPRPTLQQVMNSENFWDIGMRIKSIDKTGKQVRYEENSLNYARIIQFHARLQGIFAWDEFHLSVIVRECPPWLKDNGREHEFKVHELNDADVRECDYFIQGCQGQLRGSIEKTRGGIEDAAEKNKIHPARDYFNALEWDGVPRLDTWLIDYVGAVKDDADYVRAVGRTWIMAAVKRVFEPACKFDHMLILEGPQGAFKSTTLQAMATFGDGPEAQSYFCDTLNIRNCEDPDELMKTRGSIIVEIQEMSGFNKKDDETLKAFITQKTDQYRSPYGRKTEKWDRQFVLAGTYNPVDGIFKDPTGLRRYWVVATGNRIDIDGLRGARKQIWAEAVARYKNGESLVLSQELYDKAEVAANQRRQTDEMTHEVLEKARGRDFFETREIMTAMGIAVRSSQQSEARAINKILTIEGFKRTQKSRCGKAIWGWEPPADMWKEPVKAIDVVDEETEIPF